MKFEDLIDKPLHEMTDEEVEELVKKLSSEQLQFLEKKLKKQIKKRKVTSKKRKENEDLFNKALLGGVE